MKIKQLSLFLENRPGALSAPVKILADAKINIHTLTIAEAQQYGILRMIVKDWEAAKSLLEKHGLVARVTDVLALEVADKPGGLAEVLGLLESTGINLEYTYACTLKRKGRGVLLFRFDDPDRAIKALKKQQLNVIGSEELFGLMEG